MHPKGTNHKQFVPSRRMSNLLVHVQDALAQGYKPQTICAKSQNV